MGMFDQQRGPLLGNVAENDFWPTRVPGCVECANQFDSVPEMHLQVQGLSAALT